MAVGRIETAVVFLVCAGIAGAVGWAAFFSPTDNHHAQQTADAPVPSTDLLRAKSLGFDSIEAWQAEAKRMGELESLAKAQADTKAAIEKKSAAAEDAKQEARAAVEKKLDDARTMEGLLYARILKRSMKNPDSFNLEHVMRTTEGAFCFEYRATNSFNAIVPGQAYFRNGKGHSSDETDTFRAGWNRNCTGGFASEYSVIAFEINHGL